VTRTGLTVILSGSKVTSLYDQKKRPAKLYWTQASRRMHKKSNVEATGKKKARRVVKVQRGYVGAEKLTEKIADAKAKSTAKPVATTKSGAVMSAAVAEAKAHQKAAQAARRAGGARAGGAAAAAPKGAAAPARGGKGR